MKVSIGPFCVAPGLGVSPALRQRLREMLPYIGDRFFQILFELQRQQPISLRVLDWLCCNYSKKHTVCLTVRQTRSTSSFNIHEEYKCTLRARRRRGFDPFQRKQRILYPHKGRMHTTTVAQVGFLVWALQNGVYRYAIDHAAAIEDDMRQTLQANRTMKKTKRVPLTATRCEPCIIHDGVKAMVADDSEESSKDDSEASEDDSDRDAS